MNVFGQIITVDLFIFNNFKSHLELGKLAEKQQQQQQQQTYTQKRRKRANGRIDRFII